jgi:ribosome-binding ATPase YchF (GTP1/OBG family)
LDKLTETKAQVYESLHHSIESVDKSIKESSHNLTVQMASNVQQMEVTKKSVEKQMDSTKYQVKHCCNVAFALISLSALL